MTGLKENVSDEEMQADRYGGLRKLRIRGGKQLRKLTTDMALVRYFSLIILLWEAFNAIEYLEIKEEYAIAIINTFYSLKM